MTNHPYRHNNDESDPLPQSNSAGRKLKQSRLAQGISLDAVHEATKIPMDALKSIEEGYKVRSLSPFYLRGFMKMYAKYLGLDVEEILAEFPSPKPDFDLDSEAKAEEDASSDRHASMDDLQKEPIFRKLAGILNPQTVKMILSGLLILVFLFVAVRGTVSAFRAAGRMFSKKSGVSQVQKAKSSDVKSKPVKQQAAPEKPLQREQSVPVPAAVKTEDVQDAVKTQVTLTVRATKDSWFQVRADGKMVFQSTLRSGRSESWSAKESLEISGKNINQLEYEVNGRFMGTLGRKDRQAKKLVITKDGMTVTQ